MQDALNFFSHADKPKIAQLKSTWSVCFAQAATQNTPRCMRGAISRLLAAFV
jgi:hypothetical protein